MQHVSSTTSASFSTPVCMSISMAGTMTMAKRHAVYELLELKSINLWQTCIVLTSCHWDLSRKSSCSACFTYAVNDVGML